MMICQNQVKKNKLLGAWVRDPDSIKSRAEESFLDFHDNNHLVFVCHDIEKGTECISILTYIIEDDILIIDQPTHPREERTKFWFTLDNKLMLTLDDELLTYIRYSDENLIKINK